MRLEGWGRPHPSRRGLRPLLRMRAGMGLYSLEYALLPVMTKAGVAGNTRSNSRQSTIRKPSTSMADKSNKLKARLPRGLADRGPAEIAATRQMTDAIRAV